MTINLKKTAIAAGMLTALAATSMSAHAMRETEAGEANLVPFVLWDIGPYVALNEDYGTTNALPSTPEFVPCGDARASGPCFYAGANGIEGFGVNTLIKITVPAAVGSDVIPNEYTACHSSPVNHDEPLTPGECATDPAELASANDIDPALVPKNKVHWFFMNQASEHVVDGSIDVTPDDVAIIDWGHVVKSRSKVGQLNTKAGYIVLTTEEGAKGHAADFSFFAEAWMIMGLQLAGTDTPYPDIQIGLLDAKLPVIPMNDGADPAPVPQVEATPTEENSVIETSNGRYNIWASPLVGGIRTNWSDGDGTDITLVDVTLGNRNIVIGEPNMLNLAQVPTLLVGWNDRNAENWDSIPVDIFNDSEEQCSDSISMPWQLNLIWVQTDVTAGNVPGYPAFPVPDFITTDSIAHPGHEQGQDVVLCVPSQEAPVFVDPLGLTGLETLLEGGFVKMYLPEPVDSGRNAPESAGVFFSIPLQYNVELESLGGPSVSNITLIPFETSLGHARGSFTQ